MRGTNIFCLLLRSSGNSWHPTFIETTFKSVTRRSNYEPVKTPTRTKLPTTKGTYYGLNCFDYLIYAQKTNTYQNIGQLLTRPNMTISIQSLKQLHLMLDHFCISVLLNLVWLRVFFFFFFFFAWGKQQIENTCFGIVLLIVCHNVFVEFLDFKCHDS